MKKTLITLTFIFCCIQWTSAQQTSIGVTGGFGHSWISYRHDNVFSPAFNAGLTFIYSTRTHWGFGADVKYSREGNRVEANPGDRKIKMNIDYIRVPVRVTYFLTNYEARIRPKISLAPTLGYALHEETVNHSSDGDRLSKRDRTSRINPFDFGLTGAVGVNVRLAEKIWLATELAYYNGFVNINRSSNSYNVNRNLSLNVGLTFGIGKK